MKHTRTAALAALGVAAALSLTACNGGDSGKDSSAPSSSSSAQSDSAKGGSSSGGGSSDGGGSSAGGAEAGDAQAEAGKGTEAQAGSGSGAGEDAKQNTFCKNADLKVTAKDGKPDAQHGNVFVYLTNTSSGTCSVTGFPKVMLKDRDNTSSPIQRDDNQPRVAVLKSGQRAGFNISYPADTSGDAMANPTDIEVTVPHESASVNVKWPSGGIKDSYSDVRVHPIHPDPIS
ncbi:DUF4232 domain-containing protein [Streptomyces sp. ODS28]|uniref:DUF4232 domain-containing protein n=1 Tax=Streptomyces sp. ODS28 TaxID=3136688 RepID=UPI0031EAE0DB